MKLWKSASLNIQENKCDFLISLKTKTSSNTEFAKPKCLPVEIAINYMYQESKNQSLKKDSETILTKNLPSNVSKNTTELNALGVISDTGWPLFYYLFYLTSVRLDLRRKFFLTFWFSISEETDISSWTRGVEELSGSDNLLKFPYVSLTFVFPQIPWLFPDYFSPFSLSLAFLGFPWFPGQWPNCNRVISSG